MKRGFAKCIMALLLGTLPSIAESANAYASGKITAIMTYNLGTYFLMQLYNQPSITGCGNYFAVSASPATELDRVLSRALTAKASGETITIGYDNNQAACSGGYPAVFQVG